MTTASLPHPLAPEDQARANFYALLARLFADAPDAALLHAIAAAAPLGIAVDADPGADTGEPEAAGPGLPAAWDALRAASAAIDAEAVDQEYTDLFIGVGKSEINLHASHWLVGHMMDRAAGRGARLARPARARAAARFDDAGGSPRGAVRSDAHADHRAGSRCPRAAFGATGLLRPPHRAVGFRLLQLQ